MEMPGERKRAPGDLTGRNTRDTRRAVTKMGVKVTSCWHTTQVKEALERHSGSGSEEDAVLPSELGHGRGGSGATSLHHL